MAKVGRTGSTEKPSKTAKPASTAGKVTYDDGVVVKIDSVTFAKETAEGPGSFKGRSYARITLTLHNGSSKPIDLGTTVLTVLDADGAPAAHVYAEEAKVQDFSGTLAPGKSATAVYAFAVPDDSRDKVTLVVDFDALHTSAVFRGGLT